MAAPGSQFTYSMRRKIRDVVRSLPSAQAEAVAAALRSELGANGDFIGGSLMAIIQPHLDAASPKRPRDGAYALTLPFADMLVDRGREMKRPGRIDRSSATRLVRVLVEDNPSPALAIALDAFRLLPQKVDPDLETNALTEIWRAADIALAAIADASKPQPEHIEAMGSPPAAEDLIEMARLIRIGPEIHALRRALPPPPVPELSADHVQAIRDAGERVRAGGMIYAADLLHALVGRLAQPEEILRAVKLMAGRDAATELLRRQLQPVVTQVLEALEEVAAPLSVGRGATMEEDGIIATVRQAARMLRGFDLTLGPSHSGDLGTRLARVRSTLAKAVEGTILEGAVAAISGSFLTGWDSGRTLFPAAFDERLRTGAVLRAEKRAAALAQVQPLADGLAIAASMRSVQSGLETLTAAYADRLLAGMDVGGGVVWQPAIMSLVHIMELLFGPDHADRFRRRAMTRIGKAA